MNRGPTYSYLMKPVLLKLHHLFLAAGQGVSIVPLFLAMLLLFPGIPLIGAAVSLWIGHRDGEVRRRRILDHHCHRIHLFHVSGALRLAPLRQRQGDEGVRNALVLALDPESLNRFKGLRCVVLDVDAELVSLD
jgi:hypothetical protein